MYISSYCYGKTACQGQGLLNSQTAFCLVAVTLTVANLVSCRQLAGHISLATTVQRNRANVSNSNLSDRGRTDGNVALNKTLG